MIRRVGDRDTPPTLAVVVVTRNEERRVGRCLESVLRAIGPYPNTRVVVVDSESTDGTTRVALQYDVTVCRYRDRVKSAAAGRRIGFGQVAARYVLFLDGDCSLCQDWLPDAIRLLNERPDVAVVYGSREEVIEGPGTARQREGGSSRSYGLGGNALYRADVLRAVGSFNPFIAGNEEAELLGRILAAGHRAVAMPAVMVTHFYELAKDTPIESVRRWRRGYATGVGQILRLGLAHGLFGYYLRQWKHPVIVFGFLSAGLVAALIGARQGTPALPVVWLATGAAAFSLLAIRRASVKEAAHIAADWLVVAVSLLPAFLSTPKSPASFRPEVEMLGAGPASASLERSGSPSEVRRVRR